jgi:23S rRNA (uracil1939-C5)-methyltransferase
VLDPPHGGAAAQMPPLAASGVKLVVYVGCDPAGLARDVRVLAQAAFRPLRAVPIDQFHLSPRLESVVVLAR